MPDLNVALPGAGGEDGGQYRVEGGAHTSLGMPWQRARPAGGAKAVQQDSAVGAACHQQVTIRGALAAHRVAFYLVPFVAPPPAHPVGPHSRKESQIVAIGLRQEHRLPGVQGEAGTGVPLVENLVGDFGRAPEVPGNNGAVSRVPARSIRAAQELRAFLEEEDVQGLLDGRLVASHDLFQGLLDAGRSRSHH